MLNTALMAEVGNRPGLHEERDQTAWEPISRTVPVRSSCFGSAPGGVLLGVAIGSLQEDSGCKNDSQQRWVKVDVSYQQDPNSLKLITFEQTFILFIFK